MEGARCQGMQDMAEGVRAARTQPRLCLGLLCTQKYCHWLPATWQCPLDSGLEDELMELTEGGAGLPDYLTAGRDVQGGLAHSSISSLLPWAQYWQPPAAIKETNLWGPSHPLGAQGAAWSAALESFGSS